MNTLQEIGTFVGIAQGASMRDAGDLVPPLSGTERTSMRAMIGALQRLPPVSLDAEIVGPASGKEPFVPVIRVHPSGGVILSTHISRAGAGTQAVAESGDFGLFSLPAGVYFILVTRIGIPNTGIIVLEKSLRVESERAASGGPPPSPGGGSPPPPTSMNNTFVTVSNNFNTTVSVSTNSFHTTGVKIAVPPQIGQPQSVMVTVDQSIRYFEDSRPVRKGQLVVVGGGIRAISDMTLDAEAQIRAADRVVYCVADPVTERRLHALNPSAQSLYGLYDDDKPRGDTYNEMTAAILAPVRRGLRVCVVYYGHPGVFAWSTHQSVRIARDEGFRAEMHPGISADASLFADLGIDPSQPGCHSLEATDFLIHDRTPDVRAHFLLWQAECAGDFGFHFSGYARHNFHILVERLLMFYPATHPVVIYEAAQLPQGQPKIIRASLESITKDDLTGISTLYLPPAIALRVNDDMGRRLGIL
jgi:precorrin-3B methylase